MRDPGIPSRVNQEAEEGFRDLMPSAGNCPNQVVDHNVSPYRRRKPKTPIHHLSVDDMPIAGEYIFSPAT